MHWNKSTPTYNTRNPLTSMEELACKRFSVSFANTVLESLASKLLRPTKPEYAPGYMNSNVGAALRRDDARRAPQNRGIKPLLRPSSTKLEQAPGYWGMFSKRFVILSEAKDPRYRRPYRGREHGFFTSFRMTGDGYLMSLKTLPRPRGTKNRTMTAPLPLANCLQ